MNSKEKRLSSYTMAKLATNSSTQNSSTLPLQTHSIAQNADYINTTLQYRPTSLQVDTNFTQNYSLNSQNILTAITDHDDNDFDPSAASSSSSTSSSSSSSKKNPNKIESTLSSNSSMKVNSKIIHSSTNSSSNLDHQLSFCSSHSNLSNSVSSHANTSHTSHEDFNVSNDVEKCLDSIINNLDGVNIGKVFFKHIAT